MKENKKILSKHLNVEVKRKLIKDNLSFKIAIVHKLDNGFDFKSLNPDTLKNFHNFINDIFNKKMTISQIENLYMRKKTNPFTSRVIDQNIEVREIHLGKGEKQFRLFGYFNEDSYFVLTKIDPGHKFHS
ncbi:MAG6450 family protein [Mycoplasma feriruminatoris]|uniref:MAG6450 family protein n=1 Tax=Mycoplasma feriruminatoris TaxID=1179777 RepID=UPI00241F3EBE|nr:hypothetical protein [Mycoplasma feriruminatoris]